MPMINLLPWREELRQKRKKDFFMAVLAAALLGGSLTYGTKVFYKAQISNQEQRNETLRAEITELDRQIAEINALDAQKTRLLARMEIIDQLQRSRPEAVHLMDELVDIVPEGTLLSAVNQEGARVQVRGSAQSSTRVSALMRNVDDSEWLRSPRLQIVETTGSGPSRDSQFIVFANQVRMNEEDRL
jgi:type IV pilus assembly protein PilN